MAGQEAELFAAASLQNGRGRNAAIVSNWLPNSTIPNLNRIMASYPPVRAHQQNLAGRHEQPWGAPPSGAAMSAPIAMPDGVQPGSGQNPVPLEDRLRKLLSTPITDRTKEALEKIASGIRAKKEADDEIVSGLKILEPDLRRVHKVCEAHRVIGEELGRADGQPVRRIVKPPKRKTDAPVQEMPTENLRPPEATVSTETEQQVQLPVDVNSPQMGRKVKWKEDRIDEDSFILRAVEEAIEYLPACGGEPHPKAHILLAKLKNGLGLGLPVPDSPRS